MAGELALETNQDFNTLQITDQESGWRHRQAELPLALS